MPDRIIDNLLPAIWLSLCLALPAAATGAPPPLQDQYGITGSLDDFRGRAVLVIVADTRKLRWTGRWEETLRAELPALESLRVADVTDKPRPDEARVTELLLKRVPAGVGVLIDLDNQWASAFELDTGEPCLLLFDTDHNVVARFRGRPKGELICEYWSSNRTTDSAATTPGPSTAPTSRPRSGSGWHH